MSDLTVVVCGTGSIGARHLRVFGGLSGARVLACPTRPERALELMRSGAEVASSLGDAKSRGATVAVIATDTSRHASDAADALALGMDVLVEKPLVSTSGDLTILRAALVGSRSNAFVAFNLRFSPSLQAFRAALPRIGSVDAVRIECQSYLPSWRPGTDHRRGYSARRDEGGVLRDLSHEVDYATWMFGRPTCVMAILRNTGHLEIDSEESADLLWNVAGGPVVSIRLDYLARPTRRRMTATGRLGSVTWDGVLDQVSLELAGETAETSHHAEERDTTMARQASAFLSRRESITRENEVLGTLDEAAFVVALSDAARRSSEVGRVELIEVPEPLRAFHHAVHPPSTSTF